MNERIIINKKLFGKVVSMNDNNVHIVIENEYDGIISLSEMSWLKKPPHPSKIVNINDEIEVLVTGIDDEKKGLIVV